MLFQRPLSLTFPQTDFRTPCLGLRSEFVHKSFSSANVRSIRFSHNYLSRFAFKNLKIIPIFDCFLEDHKFISNEKIIISLRIIYRDNFVCDNIELNLGKREFDYPVNRTASLKKKCQSVVDCVALRVIALNDTRGEEREVGKVRFVVRDGVTTE